MLIKEESDTWQRSTRLSAHAAQSNSSLMPIPPSSPSVTALTARSRPAVKRPVSSGVPEDDFTLISGEPKAFHYIAQSGKGLDRNFCPNCGARVFSSNLESFPGMVFVTIGMLDDPEGIEPVLEMFTKRRLEWAKPLDLPQFENMPG